MSLSDSNPRVLCNRCSGSGNISFRLLTADGICFNCLGLMSDVSMSFLTSELRLVCDRFPDEVMALNVTVPPIMDLPRIVLKECCDGFSKLPKFIDIFERSIVVNNPQIKFGGKSVATIDVDVQISLPFEVQERICRVIDNQFKSKKRKRPTCCWPGTKSDGGEPVRDVGVFDMDQLMKLVKNMDRNEQAALVVRWAELTRSLCEIVRPLTSSSSSSPSSSLESESTLQRMCRLFRWQVRATRVPLYIMGRYLKYARDVPQSPWYLEEDDSGVTAQDISASEPTEVSAPEPETDHDTHRKGRASIEEIISEAVMHFVTAESCTLHACGREDIDVRMLGNGRPFVCKIMGAVDQLTPKLATQIGAYINSRQGLNVRGDIAIATYDDSRGESVSSMAVADELVWRNMQFKAEGKHKAYRCVIHSSGVVTPAMLEQLELLTADSSTHPESIYMAEILAAQKPIEKEAEKEGEVVTKRQLWTAADIGLAPVSTTNKGKEEEETESIGLHALKIFQKTPLRVLHRRSLLARTRYISNIQTIYINKHCFLMTLVTTAGTYVKELVHGDCGRTVPSVASLFSCPVHMLQLDVLYLFDDFYHASCQAAGMNTSIAAPIAMSVDGVSDSVKATAGEAVTEKDSLYCTPPSEFDSMAPQMDRHWNLLTTGTKDEKSTVSGNESLSWSELKRRCAATSTSRMSESSTIESELDGFVHYDSACYFAHTATDSYVTYELVPTTDTLKKTVINILHTFTTPAHRGKGIAQKLVEKVLALAATRNYVLWNSTDVVPEYPLSTTCWYANVVLDKLTNK